MTRDFSNSTRFNGSPKISIIIIIIIIGLAMIIAEALEAVSLRGNMFAEDNNASRS